MTEPTWWQKGIVYQIYPRSFQDSNGDGIGDLKGIAARLDYLQWLGVDAIWISPIYPSPMADFGYDVADYRGIDPIFGTMDDFDHLLAEVHARGMKLILDFVPNHSSDQHPWFKQSRSSCDNPKRDWYIWRDSKPDGSEPNNWLANFGGPGWTFDAQTGQYYYHAFLPQQPDLNWRNPDVRQAMFDTLRFWLNKGVDGFRVDVIWHLMKDPEFRDNPVNHGWDPSQASINRLLQIHSCDHPDIHKVVKEMRGVIDEFPDRVLIGEIYLPLERLVAFYGPHLEEANLPFNFQLIFTAWNALAIDAIIQEYEGELPPGGWPNWVLSNHDQKRMASRIGPDNARLAAMLLLTLRGTPTLYYGDELGMLAVDIPRDRVQDPWEKNEPGLGFNRDPSRTPMPWERGNAAGFSTAEHCWLPLGPDCQDLNVEALQNDPTSILSLYRDLLKLRRSEKALYAGAWRGMISLENVLAYERSADGRRFFIALNFASEAHSVPLPGAGHISLSSGNMRGGEAVSEQVELGGHEGVIILIENGPHDA